MKPIAKIYYSENKKYEVMQCLRNSNLRHGPIRLGWTKYSVEVYDEKLIVLLSLSVWDHNFKIERNSS